MMVVLLAFFPLFCTSDLCSYLACVIDVTDPDFYVMKYRSKASLFKAV